MWHYSFTCYFVLVHTHSKVAVGLLLKTLGPRKDEVTNEWRKLQNHEFHNLCVSHSYILR
jgi:hypothetical protein